VVLVPHHMIMWGLILPRPSGRQWVQREEEAWRSSFSLLTFAEVIERAGTWRGGFSDAGHDRIWDSSGDAGDVKVQAICL
jgi:hypothetical protein